MFVVKYPNVNWQLNFVVMPINHQLKISMHVAQEIKVLTFWPITFFTKPLKSLWSKLCIPSNINNEK